MSSILGEAFLAFGRTESGIPFGGSRGQLTDIFFLICSVDDSQHLRTLARLSRLISAPGFLDALRAAESSSEVLSAVHEFEHKLDAAK